MVSSIGNSRTFVPLLQARGAEVVLVEKYNDAAGEAKRIRPDAIVFVVPVYWESVIDFVKEIRKDMLLAHTPMLYIGNLIEGADMSTLQAYNVKTMALGPVPTEEMVRFILHIAKK